ncbi:MAG: hypothetical protein Q9157_001717 [Trypethelium eluteriae]
MAAAEDPASVLEQFIHDAANLPAEIAHLLEEIQAKDAVLQQCKETINKHDGSLQKFVKMNGGHVKNPKEESYHQIIRQNYDTAETLQAEQIGLSEKAVTLIERHMKRLDIKLRDLQNDGSMPLDPNMPSLLRESVGNQVPPPSSNGSTGVNTPLNPLSINTTTGGSANIANAAMARMASHAASGRLGSPAVAGMQPHPMATPSHLASATSSMSQNQREMSVGSESKRRKLNQSLSNLPTASSNLARQSSLGPGTPKAGTPGSRAGSAGPRPAIKKATSRKVAPHQQMRKKVAGRPSLPNKKAGRRLLGGSRASPSTTNDDESQLSEDVGSEDENTSAIAANDGAADEDMEGDEEEGDDTKYCICHSWFHWGCIGIDKEPVGDWLCDHCRKLPAGQIKKAR